MDAIRKKMQSLKAETDGLYATIQKFEDATKEYNRQADQVSRALNSYIDTFGKPLYYDFPVVNYSMVKAATTAFSLS